MLLIPSIGVAPVIRMNRWLAQSFTLGTTTAICRELVLPSVVVQLGTKKIMNHGPRTCKLQHASGGVATSLFRQGLEVVEMAGSCFLLECHSVLLCKTDPWTSGSAQRWYTPRHRGVGYLV